MGKLLEPFKLSGLKCSNRMAMAPMTRARSGDKRIPNQLMADYYTQRAAVGLIITEATTISTQANGWVNSPGIYTPEMTDGWKQVVDSVHAAKGKIFMQLWHCGRASHSSFHNGDPAVAPSAIKINGEYMHTPKGKEPYEVPKALSSDEICQTIKDYQQAAQNAKQAGFDGIEVHSANGYLLDSFLQSKTNHRDDEYGGSIQARYRMLDEVIHAVCDVWDSNRVGVRVSPNGVFNDMGSEDYREQFSYVAEQLNTHNLCYLHVMDGLGFGFHELGEPMTLEDFRQLYTGPLIGNVGYTQETAEQVIAAGHTDMIAFGRPFISNPDLVQRFENNLPLNPEADVSTWYTPAGAEGYVDFPTA